MRVQKIVRQFAEESRNKNANQTKKRGNTKRIQCDSNSQIIPNKPNLRKNSFKIEQGTSTGFN